MVRKARTHSPVKLRGADDQRPVGSDPDNARNRRSDRLQLRFIKSAPTFAHCPDDDGREVALAGRSNVGKSSVINRVSTHSAAKARVSQTPGATQTLNFYAVADGGRLVDLPGYGYAKAPTVTRQQWQSELARYLGQRRSLCGLVLIVDIRHGLKPIDLLLVDLAQANGTPLLIVLNKADKLAPSKCRLAAQQIERQIALIPNLDCEIVVFSALTGFGEGELLRRLRAWFAAVETQDEPKTNA